MRRSTVRSAALAASVACVVAPLSASASTDTTVPASEETSAPAASDGLGSGRQRRLGSGSQRRRGHRGVPDARHRLDAL